jgi:membrane-associated protease RseP (regulator of RpoE activity)
MSTAIGIILGALAILVSLLLHEVGHLTAARALGMKVTRFFAGFGPTLWSVRRRGIEYGVKAIPVGAFVKITGMTPQDEDAGSPDAMWRFPVWKRTVVMGAGPAAHFLIGFVIFWALAATVAVPNPANPGPYASPAQAMSQPAYISVAPCVDIRLTTTRPCQSTDGPARLAGLRTGDRITRVGDRPVTSYGDLARTIRSLPVGRRVTIGYLRHGQAGQASLTPVAALRPPPGRAGGRAVRVAVAGIGLTFNAALPRQLHHSVLGAIPAAGAMAGHTFAAVFTTIKKLPGQIPGLWHAITGGARNPASPVSVVGASRISGQLFSIGDYPDMLSLIAGLNIFLGLFNLVPLLPLDGGHISIFWFERLRSRLYGLLRRPDPGRVDYLRLMPLTFAVIAIFAVFNVLVIVADVVNPVRLIS